MAWKHWTGSGTILSRAEIFPLYQSGYHRASPTSKWNAAPEIRNRFPCRNCQTWPRPVMKDTAQPGPASPWLQPVWIPGSQIWSQSSRVFDPVQKFSDLALIRNKCRARSGPGLGRQKSERGRYNNPSSRSGPDRASSSSKWNTAPDLIQI